MKQAKIDEIMASVETAKATAIKDMTRFKLDPAAEANVSLIAEHYAASNLGMTCREDLSHMWEEGVSPDREINAWKKVVQMAYNMVEKMGKPLTNEYIVLLTHHKKAWAKYK